MGELSKHTCCVRGCGNRRKPIRTFPNPKIHAERFRVWLTACQNPRFAGLTLEQAYKKAFICNSHFDSSQMDIYRPGKLKRNAVPTLNLPSQPDSSGEVVDWSQIASQTYVEAQANGITLKDLPEDETDLQLADEAEILNNLHLYNAKFLDVPSTATKFYTFPSLLNHPTSEEVTDFYKSANQLSSNETQTSGRIIHNNNRTSGCENRSEQLHNLGENPFKKEEETVFVLNPSEANIQEVAEHSVASGTPEPVLQKPYFKSLKSYSKEDRRLMEICRICFRSVEDADVVELYNDSEGDSIQIKNMLKVALPDLEFHICLNNVICTKCIELVLHSYQLQQKLLLTDKKLQEIISMKNDGPFGSDVDLVIVRSLQEPSPDNTTNQISEKCNENVLHGDSNSNNCQQEESGADGEIQTASEPVHSMKSDERDTNHRQHDDGEVRLKLRTSDIGPFMCELCGKMFKYIQSLRRHLIKHTAPKVKRKRPTFERKFMCEICGQLFVSQNHLRRHNSKHTEHVCSFCNKVFMQRFRLNEHVRCRHLRNCYQCHICGKQFSYAPSLRVHMRSHYPKPKLQVCQICDKRFSRPRQLKMHLLTHSGGRTLRCDYCGRFMKKEISLRKHIQLYHLNQGKNVCEFCRKPYWKKCDLKKHIIRHHGGGPRKGEPMEETVVYTDEVIVNSV